MHVCVIGVEHNNATVQRCDTVDDAGKWAVRETCFSPLNFKT